MVVVVGRFLLERDDSFFAETTKRRFLLEDDERERWESGVQGVPVVVLPQRIPAPLPEAPLPMATANAIGG